MAEIGLLELRRMCDESAILAEAKNNILLYGGIGTGKTTFCRTAATPIIYHSFDPGGHIPLTKSTKDFVSLLDSGNIIVSNFEDEDPTKPEVYQKWCTEMDKQYRGGLFNYAGTYILDSVTTFGTALMGRILQLNGKTSSPSAVPGKDEFEPAKKLMMSAIRQILRLPCDVIVIAHEAVQDDPTLGIVRTPAFVGKQRLDVPLLFSEIYHITSRITEKDGFVSTVQTATCSRITARTRVGGHVFNTYEVANLRKMMQKAGVTLKDKKSFRQLIEEGVFK